MIEWLKRLWLEEFEVTIWFTKDKNPLDDSPARSKKIFNMKKITTKKQNPFKGVDVDGNEIEIKTTAPFDYQIKKIY